MVPYKFRKRERRELTAVDCPFGAANVMGGSFQLCEVLMRLLSSRLGLRNRHFVWVRLFFVEGFFAYS